MSAFLGPIHFRMYQKICTQEHLTKAIADLAAKKGWLPEEEAAAYRNEETRPLETIIDVSNIHGWLLDHIEDAESRYAKLVTKLLAQDAARLEEIKATAFDFGAQHALAESRRNALFSAMDHLMLDGMPCDGACLVTDSSDENFTWELRLDVHRAFWKEAGGDPAHYYTLRNAVFAGFLSKSDQCIRAEDDHTYRFADKSSVQQRCAYDVP